MLNIVSEESRIIFRKFYSRYQNILANTSSSDSKIRFTKYIVKIVLSNLNIDNTLHNCASLWEKKSPSDVLLWCLVCMRRRRRRREIIWVLLDVASTSRYAVRLVINHSLCILCSLAFSNLLSCLVCGYEGWTNLKLTASQSLQNKKFK